MDDTVVPVDGLVLHAELGEALGHEPASSPGGHVHRQSRRHERLVERGEREAHARRGALGDAREDVPHQLDDVTGVERGHHPGAVDEHRLELAARRVEDARGPRVGRRLVLVQLLGAATIERELERMEARVRGSVLLDEHQPGVEEHRRRSVARRLLDPRERELPVGRELLEELLGFVLPAQQGERVASHLPARVALDDFAELPDGLVALTACEQVVREAGAQTRVPRTRAQLVAHELDGLVEAVALHQ